MAKKKHFSGTGKEKIHTAREGTCDAFGSCNYQNNTPAAPAVPFPRQSHHVLCVSSTIRYKQDPDFVGYVTTIDAVYKNTTWCVNQGPNLKWLPLKGTYTKTQNNMGMRGKQRVRLPRPDADVWNLDLPCHDWDHNCKDGYTDEVEEDLKKKVWNRIKQAKKTGQCPETTSAEAALKQLETTFRNRLAGRGRRQGGTRSAIGKEGQGNWWLPFSMAKGSVAKSRVVSSFGRAPEPPPALARRR
jgi:hypothetical protein